MILNLKEGLNENLYLGDHNAPKEDKFDAILCVMSDDIPYEIPKKGLFFRMAVPDGHGFEPKYMRLAVNWLQQVHLVNESKTLIHCWSGFSRSVTVASLYISKLTNTDFKSVMCGMLERRRAIAPDHEKHLGPKPGVLENAEKYIRGEY